MDISVALSWEWHTPPDKWKEPRIFHSEFESNYEKRIVISHKKLDENSLEKSEKGRVYSPNKVYWFIFNSPDTMKEGQWSAQINIFNERNYIIEIKLIDYAATYNPRVEWINEKLLYIDFLWGRVLGTYFIYDVEKENIVIKEMTNDGDTPYQQFQQRK